MAVRVLQGDVITPDGVMEDGLVVIEDGVIQEVAPAGAYAPTDVFADSYLAPGFIDLHIHGMAGADVMDGSVASLERIAKRLWAHGVTGFLPTTVTHSLEVTKRALAAVCAYMEQQTANPVGQARVLGVHLEGPWIHPKAKGAQNEAYIRLPDVRVAAEVLAAAGGQVRIVSMAPEVDGALPVIRWLVEQGVTVSIAHTTATYEQAEAAIAAGAAHVTHCFNAMTGLHHRQPGVVGAALLADGVYAELIADGFHVHPAAMQLLIRVKGRDGVMLVSDAIMAADMPDGEYQLGDLPVTVRDGRATLADGTLAGSTLTLDQAVRNLVARCGVPLWDAVYMAATTPARAIGLGHCKGRIAPGYDADLVVLDRGLRPRATWLAGV
ncbi:N-acetylglucosamine-6-phosphate deacetylase [Alicyclobacillus cellulosilyticus]|uniref:N-acetylglucosamine-6-phosphate deacetylase n=1 Tax=Alicyclobacillus cellulosilyticus TaxID=1003997 RepID=A0A917K9H2_9BACL|nr:N-acetylglucosamine-6-phosphate deacetylase [Alicyclobacillus cellulosilyticus]GGJ05264.1 N-acetylglucosamine-6-phosphate deacetylase [Alicyclobacillus cellulosilyticus]